MNLLDRLALLAAGLVGAGELLVIAGGLAAAIARFHA
jgi:hypothetical protein